MPTLSMPTADDRELSLLIPDWPAPAIVQAVVTTRAGGCSHGPYASLNLGTHVGDAPDDVERNRQRLQQALRLSQAPVWLQQVHGTNVLSLPVSAPVSAADAACTTQVGLACAILTADCLPVLFCDSAGSVVASAHAGWRGLLAGVLENTVRAMAVPPATIMAWLGPAIGPQAFEVGAEVRAAFVAQDAAAAAAFVATPASGKFMADLYALARLRLQRIGVTQVYGGSWCTYSDQARFFFISPRIGDRAHGFADLARETLIKLSLARGRCSFGLGEACSARTALHLMFGLSGSDIKSAPPRRRTSALRSHAICLRS